MEELKSLSLGEIKEKIISTKNLYLVSVDYDNKDGIKLKKDFDLSSLETVLEEVKNFYKLYIFNEDFMLSVFNFGNDEYKYNKVMVSDFEKNEVNVKHIWHIVNSANPKEYARIIRLSRERNAGWLMITDDVMPNPYDREPSRFMEMVNMINK